MSLSPGRSQGTARPGHPRPARLLFDELTVAHRLHDARLPRHLVDAVAAHRHPPADEPVADVVVAVARDVDEGGGGVVDPLDVHAAAAGDVDRHVLVAGLEEAHPLIRAAAGGVQVTWAWPVMLICG